MAASFPTSVRDFTAIRPVSGEKLKIVQHWDYVTQEIQALATKLLNTGTPTFGSTIINGNFTVNDGNIELGGPTNFSAGGLATSLSNGGVTFLNPDNELSNISTFNGNLDISAGDILVDSGYGISFAATGQTAGMTSEKLTDVEQGTWTGELRGSVAAATTPATATGRYLKVNDWVFCKIAFANVDTTGASGNLQVTGLPFTNVNNASYRTIGTAPYLSNLPVPNLYNVPLLSENSTTVGFLSIQNAGGPTTVTISAGAGRYLYFTIFYQTT